MPATRNPQSEDPKHLQVFAYLLEYKARHDGNSPSYREIMSACEVSTLSLVHHYLNKLEAEGKLARTEGNARNIEITGGHWQYTRLHVPMTVLFGRGDAPEAGAGGSQLETVTFTHRLPTLLLSE